MLQARPLLFRCQFWNLKFRNCQINIWETSLFKTTTIYIEYNFTLNRSRNPHNTPSVLKLPSLNTWASRACPCEDGVVISRQVNPQWPIKVSVITPNCFLVSQHRPSCRCLAIQSVSTWVRWRQTASNRLHHHQLRSQQRPQPAQKVCISHPLPPHCRLPISPSL